MSEVDRRRYSHGNGLLLAYDRDGKPGEHYFHESAVRELVKVLSESKRGHFYCEDSWYSCPQAVDGCSDRSKGRECNCGASEWNSGIQNLLTHYKKLIDAT